MDCNVLTPNGGEISNLVDVKEKISLSSLRFRIRVTVLSPTETPPVLVPAVLSISFLPWILLILAIVSSIPVAAYLDWSKQKQAMEEAQANQPAGGEEEYAGAEAEVFDDGAGTLDEGPASGTSQNDVFGGDFGGDFGGGGGTGGDGLFDDDAFK